MTVHVLIPVFNRLAHTREILDCLRRQRDVELRILVIDDGSTDGTGEFLAGQGDVDVLKGDGQLWWAGAIDVALRRIHPQLRPGDFFLFMNNDTRIDDGYVAALTSASASLGRAVVGSIVRSAEPPYDLLDIGPRADLWSMAVWDIARDVSEEERRHPRPTYDVDFLPGRGTLYPAEVLDRVGYMRPRLLPHYHADYEFSDRARRAGFRLAVTSHAVTYSTASFGNQKRLPSWWQRTFGKGSPENILQKLAFRLLVGSPVQRATALPRMLLEEVKRAIFRTRAWLRPHLRPFKRALRPVAVPGMHRLRVLLRSRSSTIARAQLLSAIERRTQRRMEALQVYASAMLVELRHARVLTAGSAGARHVPYLRRIGADLSGVSGGGADLVFAAWDSLAQARDEARQMVQSVRVGGFLWCVHYLLNGTDESSGTEGAFHALNGDPALQPVADAVLRPDGGDGQCFIPLSSFARANCTNGAACTVRFFAARRLA